MNISGYTIQRRLGIGGQATVYLALQESLQRLVALKVLHPAHSVSSEFTTRFLNEARILANLEHRNSIIIHDVGVEGQHHYLTMEVVEGGDLKRRIREGVAIEDALDYLIAIADCLAAAHRQNIVHRDIKPSNVLFRRDGTLLLSDFGVAKRLDDDSDLTVSGTTLGSPNYLSPEQAQGLCLDGRADIYSVGAMAFEMLSGTKPYAGGSEIDTIMRQIKAPIPQLPAHLSRFQRFIDRCMAKMPQERFSSATELVSCLRDLRTRELRAQSADATASSGELASFDESGTASAANASGSLRTLSRSAATASMFLGIASLVGMGAWLMLGNDSLLAAPSGSEVGLTVTQKQPSRRSPTVATEIVRAAQRAGGAEARSEQAYSGQTDFDPTLAMEARTREQESDLPEVARLLAEAEAALAEARLTRPSGNNARDYFAQVLSIDPGNADARRGNRRIGERYASLADVALSRGDRDRARRLVRRGLGVDAANPALLALQVRVKAMPKPAPVLVTSPRNDLSNLEEPPSERDASGVQGKSPTELLNRVGGWFD